MGAQYTFKILGRFTVARDGAEVPLGAAKLRILLAALLVEAGRVVPVDVLVDRLWGDRPPAGARNAVQNYVLRVRRSLGAAVVRTDCHGYIVDVAADGLDAHRFASLVEMGKNALSRAEPEQAAARFREGLALWCGEPLADLPSERFRDVVAALREQRLAAQELWAESVLRCGQASVALAELTRLTEHHPLHERFWAQRMLALYQCGRQGEALACYRAAAGLLAEELGVDPGTELQLMHQRVLTGAPEIAPVHVPSRVRGNLPAETTSFVGRGRELVEITALVDRSRLVTLTGMGGVGKTRLALRTAHGCAPGFAHGAWLVDLAAVTEPELVDRAVVGSLGLHDQSMRPAADLLADHLADRDVLLVLDNCEHLVDEVAALVLRLLRAAPALRVLATSRERLGVPGEYVFGVPCLALEQGVDGTASEAVRLLVERSAGCGAVLAGERHGRAAVELCRRLDGIPLAIELAAVRLGTLTVEETLERLEDSLDLLTAPRGPTPHRYGQTLSAVMDWSHGLCTSGERLLWARLSVFAGTFDLPAAESVCSDAGLSSDEVLALLTGLVHKSVVMCDRSGRSTRYRLLETIRQYGRERLRAGGDVTVLRVRHSDHYRAVAAQAATEWCGPDEAAWLARLREELPNVRAALDFCRTNAERAPVGAEIAANLMRTRAWFHSGTLGEARHWMDSLATRLDPAACGPIVPITAMKVFIATIQGDHPAAAALLDEARSLSACADAPPLAYVEGVFALLVRSDPASIGRLARVRDDFRALGQHGDAHMATMFWTMAAAFLGPADTAVRACETYVAEAEASGAEWGRTWAQWCVGLTELRHRDPARALMPLRDALLRQRALDDNWGPAWGVETLAWVLAALERPAHSAELLGAAARLRRATGVALEGLRPFHDLHADAKHLVRQRLGPRVFDEAWQRGAAGDDAVAVAVEIAHETHGRGFR
ncbi:BTAD domain-containing putative transcriptional regulator [Yinghuangia aomiensis]|uniref:BTAD domain-containing putative transcriptional regulator n=1 Tax=Yinghuangia aomiensis TaxID=676205 RepID=UPI0031EBFE46